MRFLKIFFLILLVLLGAGVYWSFIEDDSSNSNSYSFQVPPNGPPCPSGTATCTSGDSRACCPSGWSCRTASGNAWCSPDSQSSCQPGTTWCGKGTGGGKKDAACCPPRTQCQEHYGYSWCGKIDDNDCRAQGGSPCGFFCCAGNQECKRYTFGPDVCSVKPGGCSTGQELCHGSRADICCNAGQCVPSNNGAANCADNQPNPPPQTPREPKTTSASGQPSGEPGIPLV